MTADRLCVLFAALLYSNVTLYGSLVLGWPMPTLFLVIVFSGIVVGMLLRPSGASAFTEAFSLWLLGYLAFTCIWFVAFGGPHAEWFFGRWLFTLVPLVAYLSFRSSPAALAETRLAILWLVLIGVGINVYDITHPFAMVPATVEGANPGRAAGFYVNANQAGSALVLGTIVAVGVVRPRWQTLFLAVSLGGVVLTASRSAILAWFLGMGLLSLQSGVSMARVSKAVALTVAIAAGVWMIVAPQLEDMGVNPRQLLERFEWFASGGQVIDVSQSERERVAALAWETFTANPFFGLGPGTTDNWSHGLATHNAYLSHVVDFGLLGLFVLPSLALLLALKADARMRPLAITAAVLLLWWGIFDHGILSEYPVLICLAWIAAASRSEAVVGRRPAPAPVLRAAAT